MLRIFYGIGLFGYALAVGFSYRWSLRQEAPRSVLWAIAALLIASPVLLLIDAIIEGRVGQVFNPTTQSWAVLFGDVTLALISASCIALGWQHLPQGWQDHWLWAACCLAIGLIAGLGFFLYSAQTYPMSALLSPTKLGHDLVTYPILFGAVLYGLVPMFFHEDARGWAWLACLGVLIWIICAICDNTQIHRLNPDNLHQPFHW